MFKKKYEVYATAKLSDDRDWESRDNPDKTFRSLKSAEKYRAAIQAISHGHGTDLTYHVNTIGYRHYSYDIRETEARFKTPYELRVYYKGQEITPRWEIGYYPEKLRELAYKIADDHRCNPKPGLIEGGRL